jgi:hypothetical protein
VGALDIGGSKNRLEKHSYLDRSIVDFDAITMFYSFCCELTARESDVDNASASAIWSV